MTEEKSTYQEIKRFKIEINPREVQGVTQFQKPAKAFRAAVLLINRKSPQMY